MGIGTSLGAFYEDEHHYNSVLWDPERFQGDELMVKTPNQTMIDKQLDDAELDPSTGLGIEVGYKTIGISKEQPGKLTDKPGIDDEVNYGNIIDRRDAEFIYPDIRDATAVPLTARAMEFLGLNSQMFDTNPPPHTGEPLKKALGYNDIRKLSKEEVDKFKRDVENMNAPADPDMSMQRQADALGDFIRNLSDGN